MALDTPKENPAYPSQVGTPASPAHPFAYQRQLDGTYKTAPLVSATPAVIITDHVPDMVNRPPHYRLPDGSEAIDHIKAALTKEQLMGYYKGNALKYTLRAERKGGAEDFKKAAWYLKAASELI